MERLGDRHKAGVCHAGQCRKDVAKEPITIDLEEVSSLLKVWSGSEEAIAKSPPKGLVTSTAVAVHRLGRNVVMTLPDLPQKGLNEFKRVM